MILYLDPSAFLKLYLDEPGSDRVRQAVGAAAACATHLIGYTEMRAGLAQALRMRRISADELAHQLGRFEDDWSRLDVIGVDEPMIRRAGQLAQELGLRGYDSVHLAAVERVVAQVGGAQVLFACLDEALRGAAQRLGIRLLGVNG